MANPKQIEVPERLNFQDDNGVDLEKVRTPPERRANDLDGATWTKNSISVWNDIRKSAEEVRLGHPALFPAALVERLIESFTTSADQIILDPFLGAGSTVLAAERRQKIAVGFEISDDYVSKIEPRLRQQRLFDADPAGGQPEHRGNAAATRPTHRIIRANAQTLLDHVAPASVDMCITSPPYWDILTQKRTADYKEIRDYGDAVGDLGKISDYNDFLVALAGIFRLVFTALKPGKYCVVNVMDLRKKDRFYAFHSDLASRLAADGWIFDDLIIWDRRQEYNNLRPLGFPSVFRINKIHEYLLIFQKPRDAE